MIRPAELILFTTIAATMLAVLISLNPADRGRMLEDALELPHYVAVLRGAKQREEEANAVFQALRRHGDARRKVIAALIDGRVSLLEATAQFHQLNATSPRPVSLLGFGVQGDSHEERLCRQVIHYAEGALYRQWPERADPVIAALEAELAAHLACGGVHLPE